MTISAGSSSPFKMVSLKGIKKHLEGGHYRFFMAPFKMYCSWFYLLCSILMFSYISILMISILPGGPYLWSVEILDFIWLPAALTSPGYEDSSGIPCLASSAPDAQISSWAFAAAFGFVNKLKRSDLPLINAPISPCSSIRSLISWIWIKPEWSHYSYYIAERSAMPFSDLSVCNLSISTMCIRVLLRS